MATEGQIASIQPDQSIADRQPSKNIHAQLFRATSADMDAEIVRAELRRIVKDTISATFAAHLATDANEDFTLAGCQVTGDLAAELGFSTIVPVATASLGRQTTQVKTLSDENQTQLICAPVSIPGSPGEILAVGLSREHANLQFSIYVIELAASYQRSWARGNVAVANQWKLNSLAAIVELVTAIEQQETLAAAANTAVNQAARYVGCARVVIATLNGRGLRIRAASGLNKFDPNSETMMAVQNALAECKVRNALCRWPPSKGRCSAMLGHKALADQCHFQSLLSCPLTTPQGELVGVWLFADGGDLAQGERLQRFIQAASPRVASAIDLVERSQRSVFARGKQALQKLVEGRKARAALLTGVILTGFMLLPVPYRVRCRCVVEPVARRYAVAPFNGVIDAGLAEPGDVVSAGTMLAEMDGRELKWELSAAQAKYEQAKKQREVELTERNVPQVLITQLEAEQLSVQLELLRYRIDHLELKSPVAGVVLTASLEKGQSTPVEKGEVLYEIGPLEELQIEVEVPANDVAQVEEGQYVKVWLDGFDSDPIAGQIALLEPRSQLRLDQNVFIAKLTVPNPEKKLRPGMRGSARITCQLRPLGWNLFHKPWEYALARLTWW